MGDIDWWISRRNRSEVHPVAPQYRRLPLKYRSSCDSTGSGFVRSPGVRHRPASFLNVEVFVFANAFPSRTGQGADAAAARVSALAARKNFLSLWKDADPDIPILKDSWEMPSLTIFMHSPNENRG